MVTQCRSCFKQYDEVFEVCPHCGYYNGLQVDEINQLPIGTMLNNRYVIGQVLGFGGFGITYKVWDTKLDAVCAIKEYYPSGFVNRNPRTNEIIVFSGKRSAEFEFGLSRFIEEAVNLAKFSEHDNIVHAFEYFEENKTAYIVMEFLDGVPLNRYLQENKISCNESVDIALKVCAALKCVHSNGIVHRDISPDNIFMCKDGRVKIIDFGAARFSAEDEKQRTIILKPGFAPPEQYESVSSQGPWTDIYALGATLYYLLTGVKPEESTNRKIEDNLQPPHELNENIPEYISNSVMKAMAVDRHLRFNSDDEFDKALNNKRKVVPLKDEVKRRKTKRFAGIIAGVLVVSLIGSVFSFGYKNKKEEATLPKANIELWYMVDDDNSSDKEAVIKEIADDFCTSYDTVKIDVVGIPENEYQKRLDEAAAANKLPAVFESGNVNLPQDTVDISGVMRSASRLYDCYLLNDYIKNGDDKRAPLGYEIPMVFANTKNSNFAEQVLDKNSLQAISSNGIVVSDAATNVFTTVYGSSVASYVSADALNDFCNSKAGFLFDFSSSFFSVDKKLTGKYKIIKVDAKNVECRMTTFFSISKLSDDEVTVSKKLIEYMYCAKCQEALHLDGKTGAFPVNKVAMSSYIDVYPSLETIKDITDKIKVEEVK